MFQLEETPLYFAGLPRQEVRLPLLLRTTTSVNNPSELAEVVSFRDDARKWGRIEGSFVNDNPVDAPSMFELKRRGMIEIVP